MRNCQFRHQYLLKRITSILLFSVLFLLSVAISNLSGSALAGGTVNVLNCGAKGDGIADDLPAVNKAMQQAGTNGTIYFPGQHSYLVSNSINLNSVSATGDGAGSIVFAGNSKSPSVFNLGGNASINNLAVTTNNIGLQLQTNGISIQNTQGSCNVSGVTFQGSLLNGLYLLQAANVTIDKNTFALGTLSNADIEMQGCNKIAITNNNFTDGSKYGILNWALNTRISSSKVTVKNNRFIGAVAIAPMFMSAISYSQVTYNIFDFTGKRRNIPGLAFWGWDSSSGVYGKVYEIEIDHNSFVNAGGAAGTSLPATITVIAAPGSSGPTVEGIMIEYNQIVQTVYPVFGSSNSTGIFVGSNIQGRMGCCRNICAQYNTIANTMRAGIVIDNAKGGITVWGNTISNSKGAGIIIGSSVGGSGGGSAGADVFVLRNTLSNCGTVSPGSIPARLGTIAKAVIDVESTGAKGIANGNTIKNVTTNPHDTFLKTSIGPNSTPANTIMTYVFQNKYIPAATASNLQYFIWNGAHQ